MRKATSKAKDKYTITEVGSIVEGLRGEIRVVSERQVGLIEKVDATFEQVGRNTEGIAILKVAVKGVKEDVGELKETVKNVLVKIEALTEEVNKNTKAIAAVAKSIDNLARTKADHEDFLTLERRVSSLESKVAALSK